MDDAGALKQKALSHHLAPKFHEDAVAVILKDIHKGDMPNCMLFQRCVDSDRISEVVNNIVCHLTIYNVSIMKCTPSPIPFDVCLSHTVLKAFLFH
jgi:hypothetical protein